MRFLCAIVVSDSMKYARLFLTISLVLVALARPAENLA